MELIYAAAHLIAELFRALRALVEFKDSTRKNGNHTSTRRPKHLQE